MKLKLGQIQNLFSQGIFLHRFSRSLNLLRGVYEVIGEDVLATDKVEGEVVSSYNTRGLIGVAVVKNEKGYFYVVREPRYKLADVECALNKLLADIEQRRVEPRIRELLSRTEISLDEYLYFKIASGFGPITPLVLDENLEEIAASAIEGAVRVIHTGYVDVGWLQTNILLGPAALRRLVLSLARRCGKHISYQRPIAEGVVHGFARVSLSYGSVVTPAGSSFVLRKKTGVPGTVTSLIKEGVLTSIEASYLWRILDEKGWIIIAGGVGSGKTTLLQALLTLIHPGRRVVTIEDVPEIVGTTGVWDPLVEKTDISNEKLAVDSYVLLKFALRRRPDYVVIGEVRGVEARLLVQASRLGHGVLTTIHADSEESVITRLTSPPISIPRNLLDNIWAIVLMSGEQGQRRVMSISEVSPGLHLERVCSDGDPCGVDTIVARSRRLSSMSSSNVLRRDLSRRALFLEKLVKEGVYEIPRLRDAMVGFYEEKWV